METSCINLQPTENSTERIQRRQKGWWSSSSTSHDINFFTFFSLYLSPIFSISLLFSTIVSFFFSTISLSFFLFLLFPCSFHSWNHHEWKITQQGMTLTPEQKGCTEKTTSVLWRMKNVRQKVDRKVGEEKKTEDGKSDKKCFLLFFHSLTLLPSTPLVAEASFGVCENKDKNPFILINILFIPHRSSLFLSPIIFQTRITFFQNISREIPDYFLSGKWENIFNKVLEFWIMTCWRGCLFNYGSFDCVLVFKKISLREVDVKWLEDEDEENIPLRGNIFFKCVAGKPKTFLLSSRKDEDGRKQHLETSAGFFVWTRGINPHFFPLFTTCYRVLQRKQFCWLVSTMIIPPSSRVRKQKPS